MKKTKLINLLVLIQVLVFSTTALEAQVGESMSEIWVDGPLDDQPGSDPQRPDAAVNSAGRSIFVWDGNSAINGGKDIFLRTFPAGGGAPTVPVRVNTFLTDNQDYPVLAVARDDSFLVVWQSHEPPEPEDNFERIIVRSQAFDSAFNPSEEEQVLSELKTLQPTDVHADVAALRDGGYIVVWRSSNTHGMDSNISIQGRRIGADGIPLEGQFQVNSADSAGGENGCAVTALADGGFLVTWVVPQVHGRRFAADATAMGLDFQINTLIPGTESETDVVTHEDGRVLVVWKDGEGGSDSTEIRGRLYGPNLVAQGNDFRINTVVTGVQQDAKAANYGRGGFFVVWESAVSSGPDVEPRSIEGRIVTGNDQFASPQFLVNEWTEDGQQTPGIGGNKGRIAIAWKSQSNAETTRNVINGRHWSICGIFCDGFEEGDNF